MLLARHAGGAQSGRRLCARHSSAIYPELAAKYDLRVLSVLPRRRRQPTPKLNQRDGLHPTAAGVDAIVAGILPKVEELVARVRGKARLLNAIVMICAALVRNFA